MRLRKIGKVKIGKDSTKGYVYPKLRLPKDFSNLIGEKVNIYEAFLKEGRGILILPESIGQIGQIDLDDLEIVGRKDTTEERISRLERAIEKLTELISGNRHKDNREIEERNGLGRSRTGDLRLVRAPLIEKSKVEIDIKAESRKWLSLMEKKVSKKRFLKAKKTIEDLLRFELSPDGIYEFQGYLRSIKSEKTGKNLSPWEINQRLQLAKQFIDYLKTIDYNNKDLYDALVEILKGNKFKNVTKQSKTPYVSLKDVQNVLRRILDSDLPDMDKLRYSIMWMIKCSTGLRSEMFDSITKENIKFGESDYLDLVESKISHSGAVYHHFIPLHRLIKPLLEAYLEAYEKNPKWVRLFDNDRIGRVLSSLKVMTEEENKRINFQFGRYFFEQYTKWDINPRMDDELRKYIMAHEIRGISSDFYDRATPQRIYNQYMAYMGEVELIPEDCKEKLNSILNSLKEGS